jgi:hypothetical protein
MIQLELKTFMTETDRVSKIEELRPLRQPERQNFSIPEVLVAVCITPLL